MDRKSWDHQFPVFARRFRVIRYDIRPFGESTRPDKPWLVPDDLLAVLDHLKIQRAHLVGHSFGGAAALDFALLHPDRVASLVLVSAPPDGLAQPPDEVKQSAAIFAAVKRRRRRDPQGVDGAFDLVRHRARVRRSRKSSRPSPRGTSRYSA